MLSNESSSNGLAGAEVWDEAELELESTAWPLSCYLERRRISPLSFSKHTKSQKLTEDDRHDGLHDRDSSIRAL